MARATVFLMTLIFALASHGSSQAAPSPGDRRRAHRNSPSACDSPASSGLSEGAVESQSVGGKSHTVQVLGRRGEWREIN